MDSDQLAFVERHWADPKNLRPGRRWVASTHTTNTMAENTSKQDHVIGVDLGGTKILAGVFDSQIKCLGRSKMSTKPQRGADEVVSRIARCVQDAIDECDLSPKQIKGVGVGAPGAVDPPGRAQEICSASDLEFRPRENLSRVTNRNHTRHRLCRLVSGRNNYGLTRIGRQGRLLSE